MEYKKVPTHCRWMHYPRFFFFLAANRSTAVKSSESSGWQETRKGKEREGEGIKHQKIQREVKKGEKSDKKKKEGGMAAMQHVYRFISWLIWAREPLQTWKGYVKLPEGTRCFSPLMRFDLLPVPAWLCLGWTSGERGGMERVEGRNKEKTRRLRVWKAQEGMTHARERKSRQYVLTLQQIMKHFL